MEKASKIAKTVVTAVVFILCGMFILRCCVAADQSVLNDLTPNDVLRAAYAQNPDLEIFTHDTPREISEDGYMAAYALLLIPEAGQVQITVRYNDSIFSYNNLPADTLFSYTLTVSGTGEEIAPTSMEEGEKWMYNYRRLVFDGVEITDDTSLTVNIYAGDEKITWQQIHHKDQNAVNEEFRLSRKDKAALTEK